MNILVFVKAFFLDFFELAFILVPLLKPAGRSNLPQTRPRQLAIAKSLGFAVITVTDPSRASRARSWPMSRRL